MTTPYHVTCICGAWQTEHDAPDGSCPTTGCGGYVPAIARGTRPYREILVNDDLELLERAGLPEDMLNPNVRRRVFIARLQREMNERLFNDEALKRSEDQIVADGFWGPRSEGLYRNLLAHGHSFDAFISGVPEVIEALDTYGRTRP